MAGVNAYGSGYNNKVGGTDANGNRIAKSDQNLNMDDFLNLLTAQMSNQDVMNPSTDMEFIGQMAQFTTLQAMKTLTELSMAQHGSSMIGKHVVVAHIDDRGELVEDRGVVSNVKFMGGIVSITVNEKEYEMSSIMEVLTEEEFNKPPPVDTDKDGIFDDDDPDMDGDGIPNEEDPDYIPPEKRPDQDGDGIPDYKDPDVDGDGIWNSKDPDYNKKPEKPVDPPVVPPVEPPVDEIETARVNGTIPAAPPHIIDYEKDILNC